MLCIDEQRLKQVLLNLLSNSLKFTFEGKIKVRVEYEFLTKLLKITVSDTGIGIKQEEREKLFTLFGKIESTANINISGIGLGLSISKKIVEMFEDGEINYDPNYTFGSKFYFSFKAIYQIEFDDQTSDRILLQNEESRNLSFYKQLSNNQQNSQPRIPSHNPIYLMACKLSEQFN